MTSEHLKIWERPKLDSPRMILGLSGWMDGGSVSMGTVDFLVDEFDAKMFAEILSDDFYIYNFPGSMEISALFRPLVSLEDGLVKDYHQIENLFYYDTKNQLILFEGKEPNLKWDLFCECIFALAEEFSVKEMFFVGSYAGLVPHTREPPIMCTVSDESIKEYLSQYQIKFSNYQGPCSIINQLTRTAPELGIKMVSLVAEIPAYVQGRNPRCLEAVLKRLAALLHLELNLEPIRRLSDSLEKKIDTLIEERSELANHIKKLEANYDEEVFDTDMGDLKRWLEQQGIRLD